jgi:hypothetical protein
MVTPWVSTRGSLLLVRINYVYLLKLKIMSILKFNDGEVFDLSGPLRVEERSDGWYVLGEGRMMAVASQSEGLKLIETLKK